MSEKDSSRDEQDTSVDESQANSSAPDEEATSVDQGDVPEGEAADQAEPAAAAEEEASKPKTVEEELLEWKDRALRRQADLENFRKRMERERVDSLRYANGNLLEDLLPILDNFQMGLDAARAESEGSMIFMGMEMVSKQLVDFLEGKGVKEVAAEGLPFDPSLHDAVSQEETTEVAEGQVIRVTRRGFQLHDRLLRPASVVVATAPKGEDDLAAEEAEEGAEAEPTEASEA